MILLNHISFMFDTAYLLRADSVRDVILKEGGVEAAKILLDSSESKLQKYGCFIVVCITQHSLEGEKGNSHDCCLALEKTKVLHSLAELIKNTNEEKTKSWSTSCLGNCAYISKINLFESNHLFR